MIGPNLLVGLVLCHQNYVTIIVKNLTISVTIKYAAVVGSKFAEHQREGARMARFTEEQSRFAEAMKLLISLYHKLKSLDPSSSKPQVGPIPWFSEPLISELAEIFYQTIPNFSPCLYSVKYSSYRYRSKDESIFVTTGGFQNFIAAMDALKEDISRKVTICFKVNEMITESHEKLDGSKEGGRPHKLQSKPVGKCKVTILPDIENSSLAQAPEKIRDFLDTYHQDLNKMPSSFDSFVLGLHDSSLFDVATTNYNLYSDNEDRRHIFSPGYSKSRISISDAIIYILVKYQWLFGSFERVKICKQCEKLFLEKRLGIREFCGGTCRKRYNDSLQAPEKRLCRERQNQWITYKHNNLTGFPPVFRLQKNDCAKCNGTAESGKCPMLIKKNKKAMQFLERFKK
jgi:hypothetical protein